ncbi:hypothetical protein M422DRAFT_29952 [Sphaerobolus stellatus SS14]|uniref:SprT-like domain-containing protein n=1 Tax=Sphaerobolus stellatus (strain SS14) TaxID=990650 RepID=A0A0C9VRQ7_SPHS4|nr:hypothetical protein M422DRAFT_29952 [Sphaerobolus stellatus SS14]
MSSNTRRSSEVAQRQNSFNMSSLTRKTYPTAHKTAFRPSDEVIPDSEEERMNECLHGGDQNRSPFVTDSSKKAPVLSVDSDDSETEHSLVVPRPRLVRPQALQEPIVISSDSDEDVPARRRTARKFTQTIGEDPFLDDCCSPRKNPTDERGSPAKTTSIEYPEIVAISDVEDDDVFPLPQAIDTPQQTTGRDDIFDPDRSFNDSAILTFDPHVGARPVPRTPTSNNRKSTRSTRTVSTTDAATATPSKSTRKKKVSAEQQHLEEYARTLFAELNTAVFRKRIPDTTELVWNIRLTTTAGKAFYHRDGQRRVSTKIELSPKVVDCEERVRHTLSHEMCHLAVWIVDNDPNDTGHGASFKAWAARVSKERPDISISSRHSYEINYKYKWECIQCGKIYGRHSKSIDVETKACGVCNPPGKLKALFETPATRRSKRTTTGSKLASDSPRASPRRVDISPSKSKPSTPLANRLIINIPSSDDEVEELIQSLHIVSISQEK